MSKILILPFHLGSSLNGHKYLSEGILEELIDSFASIPNIQISSRSTSLYFHANPTPPFELQEKLGIDYIIEGNIKKIRNKCTLSTRLIKTDNDQVILNSKNDFELGNWTKSIPTIVKETAAAIGEKQSDISPKVTVQSKAREYYLKGLYHWHRYTHKEMLLAIRCFKSSLKEDKNYALPYAAIADCYTIIGTMGYDEPLPAFKLAKENVQKSISLNNKRSESYVSAAFLNLFYDIDIPKAKLNIEYAFNLNKNNVKTHHVLAMYYTYVRNFKLAEKHSLFTIQEDPLAIPHYTLLIRLKIFQRKFKEAMDYVDAAFAIDPHALSLRGLRGEVYLNLGNLESAIEDYKYCIEHAPDSYLYYGFLSYVYSTANFHRDSIEIEQALEDANPPKNTGIYNYAKAIIKLGRGEIDDAFRQINLSLDIGLSILFGNLISNPIFSEIRKDTRYQQILDRYNMGDRPDISHQKRKPTSFLTITTNTKEKITLDPQDICYIESQDNYCTIFWQEEGSLINKVLRVTLKQMEEQLKDIDYIYRCHNSYMVNLNQDLSLSGNTRGYFLENPFISIRIPVSRQKNKEMKVLFQSRG